MPSAELLESLPQALTEVAFRHLFAMKLEVAAPALFGHGPVHDRRVRVVTGGTFESRHAGLSGRVQTGGSDWQTLRADGTTTLDVRLVLETAGGDLIGMTYCGYRHGPSEVIARLDAGEAVDPAAYYFRSAPFFETASARFAWLNGIVAVAIGHRFPDGPVYNVFELL